MQKTPLITYKNCIISFRFFIVFALQETIFVHILEGLMRNGWIIKD